MGMTDFNNGEPYFLKADIAKEGQSTVSISDKIKMRVHDNGKVLPVKWFDQNRVMNVNGMIPFIEGQVGQFVTDDDEKIVMAPDADYRDWHGSAANTRDGGWADYILTDQMFTQAGIFYGKIGLMDGNGRRLTSINIWFQVLGDEVVFGLTQKYYSDKLEKMVREFQVRTDQAVKEARDAYNKQTQASRDALIAKDAEVEAVRTEERIISNQLANYQDQIEKNDIIKRGEFRTNSEALVNSISEKLSQISPNPEVFDNFPQLQATYPKGKAGLFFVTETKHLYTYSNGKWKDNGELPLAGLTDEQKNILNNALYNKIFIYQEDQVKAPYNDLDLYPTNTVVSVGVPAKLILHIPSADKDIFNPQTDGFTVITLGPTESSHGFTKDGAFQILLTSGGYLFWRIKWQGAFTKWTSKNDTDNKFFFKPEQVSTPYDDLNTFPTNHSAVYAIDSSNVKNSPTKQGAMTVKTWGISQNSSQSGTVQLVATDNNNYIRSGWGYPATFGDWQKIQSQDQEEEEFEIAKVSLSMFGKFGVIGDSYASGVLENYDDKNGDRFASMVPEMTDNLSWPVMLSRKWGTSMLHLAKGGLSTRTWLTDAQGLKKLNASDPQDIYYLCLGINDYYGLGDSYLGVESDMDSGADSFYGNYAKIIKAIQKKAPLAKILMFGITVTPGDSHDRQQRFSDAQQKIAQHFGIPYISTNDDDLFSSDYYRSSMGSGHPSSYLYGAMAEAFERLIQRAVYKNRNYFYSYGWNGEL